MDVTVLRVETTSSTEPLAVRFTRGSRSTTTDPVVGRSGGYDFKGQTLRAYATLYRKKEKFLPKDAELTVLTLKGVERPFGRVALDLAKLCGMEERTAIETFALDRCADKRARMACRIHTKWMKGAATGGEEESSVRAGGGVGGVSVSRGGSEMEGDGGEAHNLNDFIGQDGQEEEEEEEEEEEPPPQRRSASAAQRSRRPEEPQQRPSVRGAAAAQRSPPAPAQPQRGVRRPPVEEEEEEEEEHEEEEAEEGEVERPPQRPGGRMQRPPQAVQTRPPRGNGAAAPAAPSAAQQRMKAAALQPAPTRNGRAGPPSAATARTAPPRGRAPMEEAEAEEAEEEEEEDAEEAAEAEAEVAEEEKSQEVESKDAEDSEEVVEDVEEEEEEDPSDQRKVKFVGVDPRTSLKTQSPHADVQPSKSNLKAAIIPSQATTKRDQISISSPSPLPPSSSPPPSASPPTHSSH